MSVERNAVFSLTSQACVATNRILVQDAVYEEFVSKFVENARKLVVANGMNENSDIGPLINENAVEKVNIFKRTFQRRQWIR